MYIILSNEEGMVTLITTVPTVEQSASGVVFSSIPEEPTPSDGYTPRLKIDSNGELFYVFQPINTITLTSDKSTIDADGVDVCNLLIQVKQADEELYNGSVVVESNGEEVEVVVANGLGQTTFTSTVSGVYTFEVALFGMIVYEQVVVMEVAI